MTSEPKVL